MIRLQPDPESREYWFEVLEVARECRNRFLERDGFGKEFIPRDITSSATDAAMRQKASLQRCEAGATVFEEEEQWLKSRLNAGLES